MRGGGSHAGLFFPVYEPVDDGHQPFTSRWDQARAALEETIQLARQDPDRAQALYDTRAARCRTTRALEQLLVTFDELGIPTAELSHNNAARPFP